MASARAFRQVIWPRRRQADFSERRNNSARRRYADLVGQQLSYRRASGPDANQQGYDWVVPVRFFDNEGAAFLVEPVTLAWLDPNRFIEDPGRTAAASLYLGDEDELVGNDGH